VLTRNDRKNTTASGAKITTQRKGELNPDLDSRLLVVSLIGLTLFLAASAPIWRRVFLADDIDIDTLRRHTLALLDRGIGARA